MASLCLRGGVTPDLDRGFLNRVGLPVHSHRVTVAQPPRSPVAAKMELVQCSPVQEAKLKPVQEKTAGGISGGGPEKFDRWMKESVAEIVRNLQEAPLFVHVYGGGGPETRLKTERAAAEDWAQLKSKWVKGEEPSPEGIILVEELKEEGGGDLGVFEEEEGQNGESTKAWGVLIQGKGEDGGVACYLLKTSRVGCGHLGLLCTHYCLVRVKSFRETARSQLTSCWLV